MSRITVTLVNDIYDTSVTLVDDIAKSEGLIINLALLDPRGKYHLRVMFPGLSKSVKFGTETAMSYHDLTRVIRMYEKSANQNLNKYFVAFVGGERTWQH